MAMTMRDYLRQQCEEMLFVERGNGQLYDEMLADSRNTWVCEMLKNQRVLIWQRSENLETLIQLLGGKLRDIKCAIAEDPLLAYHRWKASNPAQEVLDLHNATTSVSIVQKNLPYYRNIVCVARELGLEEVSLTVSRFITDQENYLEELQAGMPALATQLSAQSRKAA